MITDTIPTPYNIVLVIWVKTPLAPTRSVGMPSPLAASAPDCAGFDEEAITRPAQSVAIVQAPVKTWLNLRNVCFINNLISY